MQRAGQISESADTAFIGVDLAWQSERNHSGLAAFRGGRDGASFRDAASGVCDLEGVLEFVQSNEERSTVIAIDAPLIVKNPSGQRPCETQVSRRFSKAHAGAHTSNLTLYPRPGGVELARTLTSLGYRHCSPPDEEWSSDGRWFFEVYPHPAHVVLFNRARIIKYKKGRVADRKRGLKELRCSLRCFVFGAHPSLQLDQRVCELLESDLEQLRGTSLKQYEDTLDAMICAYLAFHLWRWGWSRSGMFGDMQSGYIVNPTVALAGALGEPVAG